tara:strand:+ start:794 stop:2173 length:1380 start_codon:yes stop_codon:yes gene_type:complete
MTDKNIYKIFYIFLLTHLIIWTLIPFVSNENLPLDTIEALAWGSNLDWGYYKHPPFSAFVINIFYNIFGPIDWAYYLLSQICVVISFIFVWKLTKDFFSKDIYSLFCVLILETIVFFNYTTPEFNVYVCQLPLKAGTIFFFWRSINRPTIYNWILTGTLSAFGVLTHYSFIFLILSLLIYFIFFFKKNKIYKKYFAISFIIFILILVPHIVWLFDNNFKTIYYALGRTGVENKSFLDNFLNPIIFILKQIGILSIFFLIFISIISFKKVKRIILNSSDKKILFLISTTLLPLIIVFLVSLISGAKIRTMWMSTFYLFFGVLFFYFFKNTINLKKVRNFLYIFCFIFLLSPATYLYVSISNDFKRTDYPGKEISRLVQNKWNDNFKNEINIVVGDEWFAGNLSYHLKSRPIWFNDLNDKITNIKINQGVIYTGNPKVLKKICPGIFGSIKPVGYCMIGQR